MTATIRIRPAIPQDNEQIPDIEVTGGQIFRTVDMDIIADDDPPSRESLERFSRVGHAWVAVAQSSTPNPNDSEKLAGYIHVHLLHNENTPDDPSAHIHQVTVAAAFARRGIGARLVKAVELWARDQGFPELSLTTFRNVPWNAPYYRRLGFRVVSGEELLKEENTALNHVVEMEKKVEMLAKWPRVAMKMKLKT